MKSIHRLLLLAFVVSGLSGVSYAQVYEFDNCGATGRTGPDPGDCNYGNFSVDIVGEGIQEWTVPEDGTYRITVAGAEGGGDESSPDIMETGKGAVMQGELMLMQGNNIRIMVGQRGTSYSSSSADWDSGGAGGGTFVVNESDSPILVAGGGSGIGNWDQHSNRGYNGRTETKGGDSKDDSVCAEGGVDGGGGEALEDHACSQSGGGGGGFVGGGSGYDSSSNDGGLSYSNGGVGGDYYDESYPGGLGGFGGGGSTLNYQNRNVYSGGAGGYSGGAAGAYETRDGESIRFGGGGGSFIYENAENPATSDGGWDITGNEPHDVYSGNVDDLDYWNTGHGRVKIELVDGQVGFCNFRGPVNECIMNETNQLNNRQFNVSSIFESRETAVFEAFDGPAKISIGNSSHISGLWRGAFRIETKAPRLEAGASFRPENGRIKIGK